MSKVKENFKNFLSENNYRKTFENLISVFVLKLKDFLIKDLVNIVKLYLPIFIESVDKNCIEGCHIIDSTTDFVSSKLFRILPYDQVRYKYTQNFIENISSIFFYTNHSDIRSYIGILNNGKYFFIDYFNDGYDKNIYLSTNVNSFFKFSKYKQIEQEFYKKQLELIKYLEG